MNYTVSIDRVVRSGLDSLFEKLDRLSMGEEEILDHLRGGWGVALRDAYEQWLKDDL